MRTIKIFSALCVVLFLSACNGYAENHYEIEIYAVIEKSETDYNAVDDIDIADFGFEDCTGTPIVEVVEKWQKAYATLLREYATRPVPHGYYYFHRSFILYDINKDGIPELIITRISTGISGESIYTFTDGEVVPLTFRDDFFAYYTIMSRPDNQSGIIIFAYGYMTLMQIDETSMFAEIHLLSPLFKEDDWRWYINGVEVTEDEHNEMVDFIMVGRNMFSWYTHYHYHIWPYAITETNIQSVVLDFHGEILPHAVP